MKIDYEIAQLRHLYKQMINGEVKDVKSAARGLLAPVIERLENMTNNKNTNELESEGTKIAAEIRAEYQKPIDVTVRLRQGDIDLLKCMVFQPPTNPAERKYMLDIQRLSEKELAAHLVKIAVAKVVGDYARSQISPSV